MGIYIFMTDDRVYLLKDTNKRMVHYEHLYCEYILYCIKSRVLRVIVIHIACIMFIHANDQLQIISK